MTLKVVAEKIIPVAEAIARQDALFAALAEWYQLAAEHHDTGVVEPAAVYREAVAQIERCALALPDDVVRLTFAYAETDCRAAGRHPITGAPLAPEESA